MKSDFRATEAVAVCLLLAGTCVVCDAEDWPQLKFDSRHSGNVPDRTLGPSLGFIGAVPLTDAIFTAPVVANTRVFVIDGSGVVFCIDAATLQVLWKYEITGGKVNCNNVSSPAVVDRYLHVGTIAGTYYVLDVSSGTAVIPSQNSSKPPVESFDFAQCTDGSAHLLDAIGAWFRPSYPLIRKNDPMRKAWR